MRSAFAIRQVADDGFETGLGQTCEGNLSGAPAKRIFNDAALALFELPKPATTATTYNGMLYATSAAR